MNGTMCHRIRFKRQWLTLFIVILVKPSFQFLAHSCIAKIDLDLNYGTQNCNTEECQNWQIPSKIIFVS